MNGHYQIGDTVMQNWVLHKKLGEGSFGKVYEVIREDFGETYRAALKIITVPQSEAEIQAALEEGMSPREAEQYFYSMVEDIVREFALMAKVKGTAHVVSYEDHQVVCHEQGIGWDILIRMEELTPLLAYAYAHPFTRRDVIRLGIHMCRSLELCQKYNIIHRDIKPENIFVSENGDFKLGDFGIARTVEKTMSGLSKKGTYNYMAPEVYKGLEYGFSVDIYSLGIVLYRLLNKNRVPFLPPAPQPLTYGNREQALARRMSGETLTPPCYGSGRLGEIVLKAAAYDPKDRYSSPGQMRQELEAILYSEEDASVIYPEGDEIVLKENIYATMKGRRPLERKAGENTAGTDTDRWDEQSGGGSDDGNCEGPNDEILDEINNEIDDETDSTESTLSAFEHNRGGNNIKRSANHINRGAAAGGQDLAKGGAAGNRGKDAGQDAPEENEKTLSVFDGGQKGQRDRGSDSGSGSGSDRPGAGGINTGKRKASGRASGGKKGLLIALGAAAVVAAAVILVPMLSGREGQSGSTQPEQTAGAQDAGSLLTEQANQIDHAYALYQAMSYDECISYVENDLELGNDFVDDDMRSQLLEILAVCYYEKEDYAGAASYFRMSAVGGKMSESAARDYAVCLARLGSLSEARDALAQLREMGANSDVTRYVECELAAAQGEYLEAGNLYTELLEDGEDEVILRLTLISYIRMLRSQAREEQKGNFADEPAVIKLDAVADQIETLGLSYNSSVYEMAGEIYSIGTDKTYWEIMGWEVDDSAINGYLDEACKAFDRVISLGIQKEYLYTNQYVLYYGANRLDEAGAVLDRMEEAFPSSYLPHALRGILYITQEGAKAEAERSYQAALDEYERAGELLTSTDDRSYYEQLGSLIDQLRSGGWL